MDEGDHHPLWRFACALYAQPGVAEYCLALQDEADVNVCVLLWAIWLGRQGVALPEPILREALARLAPWDEQVRALRALRRALKAPIVAVSTACQERVRRCVKAAELQAEQGSLLLLAGILTASAASVTDASEQIRANLVRVVPAARSSVIAGLIAAAQAM